MSERRLTTEEVVRKKTEEFYRGRRDHHRKMAEVTQSPFTEDHEELAEAYDDKLRQITSSEETKS